MQSFDILRVIFVLIPMILALTVHEYAHAFVAARLGDDTAARQGRLTLNPISHMDPIGTLLIPMVGIFSGVPFIGWAKPVPVSPVQFTRRIRMKTGMLLTSIAGPASNLLFAIVIAVALGFVDPAVAYDAAAGQTSVGVALVKLACWTMTINLGLLVFNLLPIPPLDGSKVLAGILPDRHDWVLDFLSRYSFVLFIAILLIGGRYIGYPIFWMIEQLGGLVGFPVLTVLASG